MIKRNIIKVDDNGAWKRHVAIVEMRSQVVMTFLHLGRALHEFALNEDWRALGYNSFKAYLCDPDVDIDPATASRLISVYKKWALELAVEPVQLLPCGYVKPWMLVPHVTEENKGMLLSVASTLSKSDLRLWIEENFPKPIPVMPPGTYNVIYADPPWEYGPENPQGGPASLHYESMSIEQLSEMELPRMDKNAVLFMWVTNAMIRPEKAFAVLDAWNFEYKTNMVWIKTDLKRPGSGYYVRGRHEFIFIATRGSFTPLDKTISPPIGSYFMAPVGEHIEKLEIMYSYIEQLYPSSAYIELFARSRREGWDAWGDEVRTEDDTEGGVILEAHSTPGSHGEQYRIRRLGELEQGGVEVLSA